tara:strand:- start:240 stop:1277 length:1038 start_codon:yes stop_codon:yes gene_type:complete
MTANRYKEAGVDLTASEEAVRRIAPLASSTRRPGVFGDFGGFAALFDLASTGYNDPLVVATTDGVGTKAELARQIGCLDTIGIDLVAMCVDDLVCVGAEPLIFLDYLAMGTIDPDRVEQLVAGIVTGCAEAGCALIGGETAAHPKVMDNDVFDLVGFALGAVEREKLMDPSLIAEGDSLVGLISPNLRSNGFSLVRHIISNMSTCSLDEPAWDGAKKTLGEELLAPSIIYSPSVLTVLNEHPVRAVSHITGGGIPGNLVRVLSGSLDAVIDMNTWETPRIFKEIQSMGSIAEDEMIQVFNLGIGMILVVDSFFAEEIVDVFNSRNCSAVVIGEIVAGTGGVRILR